MSDNTSKGRRRLLPIASFFKHSIEEEVDATTNASLYNENFHIESSFLRKGIFTLKS